MPANTQPVPVNTSKRPSIPQSQLARTAQTRRVPLDLPKISGPTTYQAWSKWWKGDSPLSTVSKGNDVLISRIPKLKGRAKAEVPGSGGIRGSQSAPATLIAMPVDLPSMQLTIPVDTEPIVSRLEDETRRSMTPIPVAAPTAQPYARDEQPQHRSNVASASSTSSSPEQQSHKSGSSSWDGSSLGLEAPPKCVSSPPESHAGKGKGKGKFDKRSPDDQWKRPAITAETFVPPTQQPIVLQHGQIRTEIPRVALNGRRRTQPGLNGQVGKVTEHIEASSAPIMRPPPRPFLEEQERQSPSPLLTSSPIPSSRLLTPAPPPTSPPLTSSPIPPSPVSTPCALAFYTIPPRHTPRPAAATDQVRKYPTPFHELGFGALPHNVDPRHHPQLPGGQRFSDLDSFTDISSNSDVPTVESTVHEAGIFTATRQGCVLRRVDGQVVRLSEAGEGSAVLKREDGEADVPRAWEEMPQNPVPQERELQGRDNDARYLLSQPPQQHQNQAQQSHAHDNHPRQHPTAEQYLDAQRYDLFNRLGHQTYPRNGVRPSTPYPRISRSNTAPGRVPVAGIHSNDHIPNGHITQARERDTVMERWMAQSHALSEQRRIATQLARSNAVKGRLTNHTAQVSEEKSQPDGTNTTMSNHAVASFEDAKRGTAKVSEQQLQAPYAHALQREEIISPCGTFHTATSVLGLAEHNCPTAEAKTVNGHRSIFAEQDEDQVQDQVDFDESPKPRSSGSNSSRESRFHEIMNADGPALFAAHTQAQSQTQTQTQTLPSQSQDNRVGVNAIQVTITEIQSPTPPPPQDPQMDNPISTLSPGTQTQTNVATYPTLSRLLHRSKVSQRFQNCKESFQTWNHDRKARKASKKAFPPRRTAWLKVREKLHLKRKPRGEFYTALFHF